MAKGKVRVSQRAAQRVDSGPATVSYRRLVIGVVAALLLLIGLWWLVAGLSRPETILWAEDVLERPGTPVGMAAHLRYRQAEGKPSGPFAEPLEFLVDGEPVGTDKTNERGLARLMLQKPLEIGEHLGEVRTSPDSIHAGQSAPFRVVIRHQTELFIVVFMDGTLTETDEKGWRDRSLEEISPMPGASAALERAGGLGWTVVYVSALDETLTSKVRQWLEVNGFPPGVLTMRKAGQQTTEGFKADAVEYVKRRYQAILAGIGRQMEDARVLTANDVRTVIIRPDVSLTWPPRTSGAENWDQIAGIFTPQLAVPPSPLEAR